MPVNYMNFEHPEFYKTMSSSSSTSSFHKVEQMVSRLNSNTSVADSEYHPIQLMPLKEINFNDIFSVNTKRKLLFY